jgi:hypothetical protein
MRAAVVVGEERPVSPAWEVARMAALAIIE